METWKTYPFNENYIVSSNGNIKNKKGHIMSQRLDHEGYLRLNLSSGSKKTTIKVHRMVAATFMDNFSTDATIDHINGIRSDNRLENLSLASGKINTLTMITNRKNLNDLANQIIQKIGYEQFEKKLKEML